MLNREARLAGYMQAGEDFLADRIEGLFRHIVTEQDKALHNAILEEVLSMTGDDESVVKLFFRSIAHKLLTKRKRKQNLFSKIVAKSIFSVRRKQ